MAVESSEAVASSTCVVDEADIQVLSQGAEARLYTITLFGRKAVVKERFRKTYRLKELDDKLTQKRMMQEVRSFVKAMKVGVDTPCLYMADQLTRKIYMEHIEGGTVKAWLHKHREQDNTGAMKLAYDMGTAVARLHDGNITHGDLTTSNFMLRPPENTVVLIDFGLSGTNTDNEEKAVDLYLLEKAFAASHDNSEPLVDEVLRAYKATSRKASAVLHRLGLVRQRGRKRDMTG